MKAEEHSAGIVEFPSASRKYLFVRKFTLVMHRLLGFDLPRQHPSSTTTLHVTSCCSQVCLARKRNISATKIGTSVSKGFTIVCAVMQRAQLLQLRTHVTSTSYRQSSATEQHFSARYIYIYIYITIGFFHP